MKNEHEFNTYLNKQFRKCTAYKAVKISDRFKIGLPDWLIFSDGRVVAVECKWAKHWLDNANMLTHALSKPQVSTLSSFDRVYVPSAVLIGVESTKQMIVGHHSYMSKSGNITGRVAQNNFDVFDIKEVHLLLEHLFLHYPGEVCI